MHNNLIKSFKVKLMVSRYFVVEVFSCCKIPGQFSHHSSFAVSYVTSIMSGYLDEKKTNIFIKHLYKQRKYFSNSWKKDFIKQELLIAYIYIFFMCEANKMTT